MGFEVNDLKDVLQPKLHVDEFHSKLGRDDKYCVISFAIDDPVAAQDLISFLERGYEFVIDADMGDKEIGRGRWVVFMEIRRLSSLYDHVEKILMDLRAASGLKPQEWQFKFMKQKHYQPLTREAFENTVPLTSRAYRKLIQEPINQMKTTAGLPVKTEPVQDQELQQMQNLAGI